VTDVSSVGTVLEILDVDQTLENRRWTRTRRRGETQSRAFHGHLCERRTTARVKEEQ
jgi:hypothetical protein